MDVLAISTLTKKASIEEDHIIIIGAEVLICRKKYIQRKYRTFVGNKANHPATSIKVTYAEHNVATSGILTTHCNLRALATK